jgi:hypothetical protein
VKNLAAGFALCDGCAQKRTNGTNLFFRKQNIKIILYQQFLSAGL